ncbi:MAG: glycosyltransferase [Clostridia bacterium]|nr:glycosyltransferase [Clostridia bacterium]
MKISVCIPMYNENRVIAETARTLSAYMQANFEDYEIVFCSDGSTDGCDETVRALNLPSVKVIGYVQNQGKGHAVRTAMLAAEGDIRMFTDADLAYGTDVIKQVADAFAQKPEADLVIGSRNLSKDGYEGYTFLRKLMSKVYIRVLCIAGGFRLSDSQCGCKAFRGTAAEKIFSRCEVNGFAFDFEAILWAVKMKMHIAEIPVHVINHGESKVRIVRDTIRMLRDLRKMKKRIKKATIDQ